MRADAWASVMSGQNAMTELMREIGAAGPDAVAPQGVAAHRLRKMRDFYALMLAELPALLDRWRTSVEGTVRHRPLPRPAATTAKAQC